MLNPTADIILPLSYFKSVPSPHHKSTHRSMLQTVEPRKSKSFRSGRSSSHHQSTTINYKKREEGGIERVEQGGQQVSRGGEGAGEGQFSNLHSILKKYQEVRGSENEQLKKIVTQQLVEEVKYYQEPFCKLHPFLAEILLLMGKIQIFEPGEDIKAVPSYINFVLMGTAKLYNQDYKHTSTPTTVFGAEPTLFHNHTPLKAKACSQACLLMVPLEHYQLLRARMITTKLKHDFQLLQSILRLNFISKHLPRSSHS